MKHSHALADSLLTSLDPQTYLIGELFAGAGDLRLARMRQIIKVVLLSPDGSMTLTQMPVKHLSLIYL